MKSLAKNTLYNIIYKCLNLVFPLITAMYVSRTLLPVGIGRVSGAQNIVSYFIIIASLGIPTYGIKKIAECGNNVAKRTTVFYELFVINLISTSICSIAYILLIYIFPYFSDKTLLSLVVGIQLFANVINVDWFYQGVEEYRYIMLRSCIVKVFSLIAVFLFVKTENDFTTYALISSLSAVANYFFNIFQIRKYIAPSRQRINACRHVKSVMILLAATIAIEIYTLADTTMLNFMKGAEIVGYYSSALKIIAIIRMLVAAVCAVFLPKLSFYYSSGNIEEFRNLSKTGIGILLTLACPSAIGACLLSRECISLFFGEAFLGSVVTMSILSLSIITVALSNFMGYQVLVTIGKEKIVMYSTIFGACINVILNFVLIPQFAHNGAAVASVVTEFSVAIFQMIAVNKNGYRLVESGIIKSVVISTIVMGTTVVLVKLIVTNIYFRIILSILSGMVIYFTISILTKNPYVMSGIKLIEKKLQSI